MGYYAARPANGLHLIGLNTVVWGTSYLPVDGVRQLEVGQAQMKMTWLDQFLSASPWRRNSSSRARPIGLAESRQMRMRRRAARGTLAVLAPSSRLRPRGMPAALATAAPGGGVLQVGGEALAVGGFLLVAAGAIPAVVGDRRHRVALGITTDAPVQVPGVIDHFHQTTAGLEPAPHQTQHRRGMEPAQHWEGTGPDTAVAVIEAEQHRLGGSGCRPAWAVSS